MTETRANSLPQFNLRSLLIFIAVWAMFLTLVFSRQNPWPIVLMSIIYLLLLGRTFRNCYRASFMQGLIICGASLLFVLSLYLPAIQVSGAEQSAPAYGWTCAWVVASPNVARTRLALGIYGAMRLGNLLAVMSPWFVRRMIRRRDGWYPWLMLPCAAVAWTVPLVEGVQLKIGYFCWALSLIVIGLTAFVPVLDWVRKRRRTSGHPQVSSERPIESVPDE